MSYKILGTIAFCTTFILSSCEEVIDIDLNDASPQLVVEATIEEGQTATVILTETSSFFDASESAKVTDAVVRINDNQGGVEVLQHVGNGIYQGISLTGTSGTIYELSIEYNDQVYTAISTMYQPIPITELDVIEALSVPGGPGSGGPNANTDPKFNVVCLFQDPASESNFYRAKTWKNGEYIDDAEYYIVSDDELNNGNEMGVASPRLTFTSGDSIVVELLHIDEATYDYFDQLIEVLGGGQGQQSDAPYNPDNNISGDALGYFAAWAGTRDTVVID